jgi:hypothetical protein
MTPAEAREIDRQEFEAECAAVRQRLYMHLSTGTLKATDDARVRSCIDRGDEGSATRFNSQRPTAPTPVAPTDARKGGQSPIMYDAFGKSKTLNQWAEEYTINPGTIRTRLQMGWGLENALRTPVKNMGRRAHKNVLYETFRETRVIASLDRGVVSDFEPPKGTGAGSTAQENRNITFSGIEA